MKVHISASLEKAENSSKSLDPHVMTVIMGREPASVASARSLLTPSVSQTVLGESPDVGAKLLQSHRTLMNLCTVACQAAHPRDSLGKIIGVGCHAPACGSSHPGIEPMSLNCLLHPQAGSLPLVPATPNWFSASIVVPTIVHCNQSD